MALASEAGARLQRRGLKLRHAIWNGSRYILQAVDGFPIVSNKGERGHMSVIATTKTSKWWDKTAERYAKRPIADEESYQKKLQITRRYFSPEMKVLEFGCGTGSTAILHSPYVKHIHAIDISPNMIAIANEKAKAKEINNLTFEVSTIEAFESEKASYDMILGLNILHLLENEDQVVAKVYELLKPGGCFVTSTPCIADSMKFFKFIAPIGEFFGFIPFVKVFSKKHLMKVLFDAGFTTDHEWQPGTSREAFLVLKKSDSKSV